MEHASLHTGEASKELRIADHVIASAARQSGLRICILTLLLAGMSRAAIVTFDDLPLAPDSYWNGADGAGGFTSGGVRFANHYNADWAFWDGFA